MDEILTCVFFGEDQVEIWFFHTLMGINKSSAFLLRGEINMYTIPVAKHISIIITATDCMSAFLFMSSA